MLLGNKLTTIRLYDAASGRIKSITTGVGFGSSIQHLAYQFDAQGNLRERVDRNLSNLTETFGYDDLNRLTSAGIIGIGEKTYAYDALGNMTTKGLTSEKLSKRYTRISTRYFWWLRQQRLTPTSLL